MYVTDGYTHITHLYKQKLLHSEACRLTPAVHLLYKNKMKILAHQKPSSFASKHQRPKASNDREHSVCLNAGSDRDSFPHAHLLSNSHFKNSKVESEGETNKDVPMLKSSCSPKNPIRQDAWMLYDRLNTYEFRREYTRSNAVVKIFFKL